MRTPKSLYVQQRRIYHPELLSCPTCGDLLVGCNYLKWDKTVQTLDQVLSIASQLTDERQRVDQHRQRFRFAVRSVKRADAHLDRLLQQWLAIPQHSGVSHFLHMALQLVRYGS
jgi:hypothetical protein